MAISDATTRRILDAARIEEVVGEYVTLRRRGSSLLGLCPFHNEKTPSFHVNTAKNFYHCFGCGAGGGAAKFIMEMEHVSFPDALRILAKKYGIEIEETQMTDAERQAQSERDALFAVNAFASKFFQQYLWDTDDGRSEGLSYYRNRGFSDEIIRRFQLGYAPNASDALCVAAKAAGYPVELLLKAGLAGRTDQGRVYDKFRGRVMFPVMTISGRVVAFSGRILIKDEKTAKYVNSPETPIYRKSNEVYGLYVARKGILSKDVCYLVEGNADVVSMHQAGVDNVVASLGTALTSQQAQLIHRQTENVAVLYDGDQAGIHAALKAVDLLLAERFESVRVLLWPEGEDPDSFAQSHNADELLAYVDSHMEDGVFFKLRMAMQGAEGDPARTAQAINLVAGTIAAIPAPLLRSTYVRFVAEKVNMREEELAARVQDYLQQQRSQQAQEKLREERRRQVGESLYAGTPAPPREMAPLPESEFSPAAPPQEMAPLPSDADVSVPDAPVAPVPAAAVRRVKAPTSDAERNLLHAMISYGRESLAFDYDPQTGFMVPLRPDTAVQEGHECMEGTMLDYLVSSLQADQLTFNDPVYQRVYEEIIQKEGEGGLSEVYFLNHPDPEVQQLFARLVDMRSTATEENEQQRRYRFSQMAYQLLLEYRDAVLSMRQKEVDARIRQTDSESEELDALIRQKDEIKQLRRQIGKLLGTRVYMQ
ncbi:MAG: DNA primase [Paludibacteraceae bacterium]|nr:DNA primase [Paludibacteraceae bacterium]